MAYWFIQISIALVLFIVVLISNKIELEIYGASYVLFALVKSCSFIVLTHFLIRKTAKSKFFARKSKLVATLFLAITILGSAALERAAIVGANTLLLTDDIKTEFIEKNGDPWKQKKAKLEQEICINLDDNTTIEDCTPTKNKRAANVEGGYKAGYQLGRDIAKVDKGYKEVKRFIVSSIFFLAWATFYIVITSARSKRYKSSPLAYICIQLLLSFVVFSTTASLHGFESKPDVALLAIAVFNVVITLFVTHLILRKAIHFLRKQEVGVGIYFAALVPLVVLLTYGDFNLRELVEYKLSSFLTPLETVDNDLNSALPDSNSLGRTAAFYIFWLFAYFPLSTLNNRMQIKRRLKSGQLSLLISQLNPHFLFNALNSLRGMIYENKELANDLVDKLTELFRYSLNTNNQFTVSLKDELHICEVYLDIEHIRLEERLLLEINIEEGCDYIEVPPMSLLTLIENAIKHAISPRPEQSLLKVDIKLANENIVMTVTNPIYKGKHTASGTGTGLSNLLTRMQLMYGEKASLSAAQDDEYYCATLVLPISEA